MQRFIFYLEKFPCSMKSSPMQLLGIDIGGTKTSVCVGTEKGEIRFSKRMPSRTPEGPQRWAERTFALIDEVLAECGLGLEDMAAIGMSAPGPLSVKKGALLDAPNMTDWGTVAVVPMFEGHLGRRVHMNNDANAAALAEWMFGAYKGADGLIYLTMSTGLGAGIIANGALLQGISDSAGEVGYHVLDPGGPVSPCGHRGSFEAFCGGKNVADQLRARIAEERIDTAILRHAGGDPAAIDFKALTAAVREGDPFAQEVWDGYIAHLAQGIGNLMMIINPEVIVLGTIAIHAGALLFDPLREQLPAFVIPSALAACRVVPSSLGPRIGDMAALALAAQAVSS
ncbi:MAG: ROK family protein [Spartobacteria bacterium]|nr:ROK family protein [Spartobacteria bacterium]